MTDKTLSEELAGIGELVKESKSGNIVSLSLWKEAKKATPKYFIRSALFLTIQEKEKKWLAGETIYNEKGITVKFTGQQLNHDNLALWEALVRRATLCSSGIVCTFVASSLLIELGLLTGKKEQEELHGRIRDLIACSAQFYYKKNRYFGSPVYSVVKETISDDYHWTVELNENFVRLYEDNKWTAIFDF